MPATSSCCCCCCCCRSCCWCLRPKCSSCSSFSCLIEIFTIVVLIFDLFLVLVLVLVLVLQLGFFLLLDLDLDLVLVLYFVLSPSNHVAGKDVARRSMSKASSRRASYIEDESRLIDGLEKEEIEKEDQKEKRRKEHKID